MDGGGVRVCALPPACRMTAMDSWFWVMSSCFWHAASATRREGEVEGCATQAQPPWIGCPHAPSKPWSMHGASGRHDSAGMPGVGSV